MTDMSSLVEAGTTDIDSGKNETSVLCEGRSNSWTVVKPQQDLFGYGPCESASK
jgi:hypothetical protein